MNYDKYQAKFKRLIALITTLLGTGVFFSSAAVANRQPRLAISPATTPVVHSDRHQDRLAQASDVAGNWAEPFIQVLVQKGIIAGYPDGTFQPDRAVTRAEFAALLTKAFDLPPTRESQTFADVRSNFWGAAAIDKAARAGFLAGYPDNSFKPNANILRIESLVSIANGSKLQPDGSPAKVDELFTDAAQVPSFGRNALIAATQKCLAVSVAYPDGKTFNPTAPATRSDVAAFIHQALVASGKLPALAGDNPAQKYIVNCAAATPTVANITEQDVLKRVGIGGVPKIDATTATIVKKPANAPVTGVTTPSAFGANGGIVFVGAGYQESLSPTALLGGGNNTSAFGLAAGFGIGNSRDLVGLETSYRTGQNDGGPAGGATSLGLFSRGGVNFKLHKQLGDNLAIAAGWENALRNGYAAGDVTDTDTLYGVVTGILPVGDANNFTASVGVGNGRFRSIADIFANNRSANSIFGSLGFRVSENIGLVADYNGRNFSLGLPLSFRMSDNVGLQVTPSLLDFAGDKVSGELTRFGIGGGVAIRF
jgi:S-layer homology domain